MTTATVTEKSPAQILAGQQIGGNVNSGGLPYPEPGRYRLRIKRCKALTVFPSRGAYVVEMEVVTSQSTEQGKPAHPPGALFGWMQMMDWLVTAKNLTLFAAAALGCAPKDVTMDHLVTFCDEKGGRTPGGVLAALGVEVDALFFSAVSKGKGNPITKVTWTAVPGKTLADLVK